MVGCGCNGLLWLWLLDVVVVACSVSGGFLWMWCIVCVCGGLLRLWRFVEGVVVGCGCGGLLCVVAIWNGGGLLWL